VTGVQTCALPISCRYASRCQLNRIEVSQLKLTDAVARLTAEVGRLARHRSFHDQTFGFPYIDESEPMMISCRNFVAKTSTKANYQVSIFITKIGISKFAIGPISDSFIADCHNLGELYVMKKMYYAFIIVWTSIV